MLVASDHLTNKDYPAANMVKGDLFVRSSMRGYTAQVPQLLFLFR